MQIDKKLGLCRLGKFSCPSVPQSWVNWTKALAFFRGYSLCALFCLQKETGNLVVVKMNHFPLLLFLSHECLSLCLEWFLRVYSHLDCFLTHEGTLHGNIHAPIQLMSICTSAGSCGWGLLPLPPKRPCAAADFSSGYLCTSDVARKLDWRVLLLMFRGRLGILTHSLIH